MEADPGGPPVFCMHLPPDSHRPWHLRVSPVAILSLFPGLLLLLGLPLPSPNLSSCLSCASLPLLWDRKGWKRPC